MEIAIKYFSDEIERLRYIDGKSDWVDLRASVDVSLKKGEFALIPLGIAMQLPAGYEAHVVDGNFKDTRCVLRSRGQQVGRVRTHL